MGTRVRCGTAVLRRGLCNPMGFWCERDRRVRANCSAHPPGCGGSGALSGAGLKSEQQKALLGVPGPRRRLGVKE